MKRPILDETFMEDVLDGIGACIRGFAESKAKRLPGDAP